MTFQKKIFSLQSHKPPTPSIKTRPENGNDIISPDTPDNPGLLQTYPVLVIFLIAILIINVLSFVIYKLIRAHRRRQLRFNANNEATVAFSEQQIDDISIHPTTNL